MTPVLDSVGKIQLHWHPGASPVWPLLESLPEAPKMLANSKARVLVSFEPFNFWVSKSADIYHQKELKLAVFQALFTVRECYTVVEDLYPLVEEARKSTSWCRLMDALLTLGNLKGWWLTPSGGRVWTHSLVINRYFNPSYSSPEEQLFLQQLSTFNKDSTKEVRVVLPSDAVRGKRMRAANWSRGGGRGRGRGRGAYKQQQQDKGKAPQPDKGNAPKKKSKRCYNCGSTDHIAKDCHTPMGTGSPRRKRPKAVHLCDA